MLTRCSVCLLWIVSVKQRQTAISQNAALQPRGNLINENWYWNLLAAVPPFYLAIHRSYAPFKYKEQFGLNWINIEAFNKINFGLPTWFFWWFWVRTKQLLIGTFKFKIEGLLFLLKLVLDVICKLQGAVLSYIILEIQAK